MSEDSEGLNNEADEICRTGESTEKADSWLPI